jgi:hypothetical protein
MSKRTFPIGVKVSLNDDSDITLTRTKGGGDASTIEAAKGEKVAWIPSDRKTRILLLFAKRAKPVAKDFYLGDPGETITVTLKGDENQSYKYAVGLAREEIVSLSKEDLGCPTIPAKVFLRLIVKDPVIIIRNRNWL